MGKHVQAPPAPDYTGAVQAQAVANTDAAKQSLAYSNPNVFTPYGSQTTNFTYNPLTGQDDYPQIFQSLNPIGQQTVDQQQQAQLGLANLANQQTGNVSNILNTPFSFGETPQQSLDLSGVAKMPVNAGVTGQDAILSRLQPQLDRQRASLNTQLVNQGLTPGSEAYDNAMRDFGQQENDARQQAIVGGLNLDLGANQQGFNQALQGGQFGNTAIQQKLAQALQQRDLPLNEINALMSSSQVQNPQFPGYQGTSVTPAPVFQGTQAQGAWDQNMYNQQVAQQNSGLGGLFSLGGSILGGPLGGMIGRGIGGLF